MKNLLVVLSIVVVLISSGATQSSLYKKNIVGVWRLKSITTESQWGTTKTSEENHPDFFKEYRKDGTFENRAGKRTTNTGRFEIEDNYIKEHVAYHDNPFNNLSGQTVDLEIKLLSKDELKFSYSMPGVAALHTEHWVKER